MVIKLSNSGAPKKFFDSLLTEIDVYKYAKLTISVHHIYEIIDIYDAIGIAPSDFIKNLQNEETFKQFTNLSKFLFLISEEMPFTLAIITISNGEEADVKSDDKIIFGHKIMILMPKMTNVSSKVITNYLKKQINKKQKSKWIPKSCIHPNKKFLRNCQSSMLIDYEKCYNGSLKKLLKMIKVINKKEEPIKILKNSTVSFLTGISGEDFDNVIKLITVSLNIYETIEFKFLGGEKLIKAECQNQLLYYKTNFEAFILDFQTALQMIANEFEEFQPASNIAKFLPGIYQSCYYLFTILLENITIVKDEIENCSKLLADCFKANKIISELIWFSQWWFYSMASSISCRALEDYRPSSFSILVNSKTINQIAYLFHGNINNDIIWIFDETPSTECQPKIIADGKKYLFGLTVPAKPVTEKSMKSDSHFPITYEIFADDHKPRFWLCLNCKCLLQTILRDPLTVKCQCQITLFEKLLKYNVQVGAQAFSTFIESVEQKPIKNTVTMDLSLTLTPHIGEVFVDIVDKERRFIAMSADFVESGGKEK